MYSYVHEKFLNSRHIGGEQRARAATFEQYIGATAEALAIPEVAKQLEVLGEVDLVAVNAAAVLPNIRRGVVELPKSAAESNGPAVLPITRELGARGIKRSESMLAPTPKRKVKNILGHPRKIPAATLAG